MAETFLKVPTIRGPIECALSAGEDKWQMELLVPGNSRAMVLIPSEFPELLVNGEKVQADSQIHYLGMTRNMIRLKGGSYRITAAQ